MNRTAAYLVFGAVALVGLAGYVWISSERPEQADSYVANVVILLGVLSTAAVTMGSLNKVSERVAEVEKNTNGRLHALSTERDRAKETLARLGLDIEGNPLPDTGAIPTVTTD